MVQLTASSSRKGRAIATFLNFSVSNGSETRFFRNGEKYYIYFIENLLLFPTVKEFLKSVNSINPWECSDHRRGIDGGIVIHPDEWRLCN